MYSSVLLLHIFVLKRGYTPVHVPASITRIPHIHVPRSGSDAVDLGRRIGVAVLVDFDAAVFSGADHGVVVDVDPEADAVVGAVDTLDDLLRLYVPEHDGAVFARRSYERSTAFVRGVGCCGGDGAETPADAEPAVLVPLVCLLHRAGYVVPQAQTRVHAKGEDVAPVGRETDGGYWGVVFVHEGSETLARGRVPYSAIFFSIVSNKSIRKRGEGRGRKLTSTRLCYN